MDAKQLGAGWQEGRMSDGNGLHHLTPQEIIIIIIVIIIIIKTLSAHKWNLVDISSVDEPTSLPSSRGKLDSKHLDKIMMVMVMTNL